MRRIIGLVGLVGGCAEPRHDVVYDGVHLSTEGLYCDIGANRLRDEAIAFAPQFPLWSDGATKQRWMVLPDGGVIDNSDLDHWQLPVGAKLFKEFAINGRRVETRVIERTGPGADDYRFAPYAWLPDESDAVLVTEGVFNVNGTSHDIPPADECMLCHSSEPGRVLGVSAIQLGQSFDQLPLARAPSRGFAISEPALGVLHANCGHCHSEQGIASFQQLRFSITDSDLPIEQTAPYRSIVGVELVEWTGEPGITYRVKPGDAEHSAIYRRMASRDPAMQMPPVATELADQAGLAVVARWIDALPDHETTPIVSPPLAR